MSQEHALASLIGSRICHDLISPIGAITNGFELLNLSGDIASPEMSLIGESVASASARLRFYRIAFGAAGDQMVGAPETQSILRDLYGNSRLDVRWLPTTPHPRTAVRLAFLAILCLETGMPYGGALSVTSTGNNWCLEGEATRLNIDESVWTVLSHGQVPVGLQPAHVQFILLPLVAADCGRNVQVTTTETTISLQF